MIYATNITQRKQVYRSNIIYERWCKMEILSYFMAAGALLTDISTALFIDIRKIIVLQFASNVFTILSFLCIAQFSGASICIIACIMLLVNFFFRARGKKIPLWVIGISITAMLAASLITFRVWYDMFSVAAGIMFVMEVAQKNGKHYRKFAFFNILFWIIYDALSMSWGNLFVQIILIVINLLAQRRDKKIIE